MPGWPAVDGRAAGAAHSVPGPAPCWDAVAPATVPRSHRKLVPGSAWHDQTAAGGACSGTGTAPAAAKCRHPAITMAADAATLAAIAALVTGDRDRGRQITRSMTVPRM